MSVAVSEFRSRVLDPVRTAMLSGDLSPAGRAMSDPVRRSFGSNFGNGGSPLGPWPPRKKAYPWPMLMKSLAMYNAATSATGRGHLELIGSRDFAYGIDLTVIKYARAQNYGYPPRNLPARTYLYVDAVTVQLCAGLVKDQMLQLILTAKGDN